METTLGSFVCLCVHLPLALLRHYFARTNGFGSFALCLVPKIPIVDHLQLVRILRKHEHGRNIERNYSRWSSSARCPSQPTVLRTPSTPHYYQPCYTLGAVPKYTLLPPTARPSRPPTTTPLPGNTGPSPAPRTCVAPRTVPSVPPPPWLHPGPSTAAATLAACSLSRGRSKCAPERAHMDRTGADWAYTSDMRLRGTRTTRSTRIALSLGTRPPVRAPWGSALHICMNNWDRQTWDRPTQKMRFFLVRVDLLVLVWNPPLFERDPHPLVKWTKLDVMA